MSGTHQDLTGFLHGELPPEQQAAFVASLADDPVLANRLLAASLEEAVLREWARQRADARAMDEGAAAALVAAAPDTRASLPAAPSGQAWLLLAGWLTAGAAALVVVAALYLTFAEPPPIVATVRSVQGAVRVSGGKQPTRPAWAGMEVAADETLASEENGQLVLSLADGTSLTTAGRGSLTWRGAQGLALQEGFLVASVARRPAAAPLVISTPAARIDVLGTEFCVAATPEATDLAVQTGRVQLTRQRDGESIEVRGGERATASPRQTRLASELIVAAADHWQVDFERGLPDGWADGRLIDVMGPHGSRRAVAAQAFSQADGVYYGIKTPKAWSSGLFALEADSHLHFTYRLAKPDWFQIFLSMRRSQPGSPATATYRFKDERLWWPLEPGQWRTATIPLAAFGRVSDFSETPPAPGELPFELLFSSKDNNLSLVIDRMWVTRGGPGKPTWEGAE